MPFVEEFLMVSKSHTAGFIQLNGPYSGGIATYQWNSITVFAISYVKISNPSLIYIQSLTFYSSLQLLPLYDLAFSSTLLHIVYLVHWYIFILHMNFTSTATSGEQSFLAHAALWRQDTEATLRNVEQQWNWPPEPWKFQYQKMEGSEREPWEKTQAQTIGHTLPRLHWEEEMEGYKESAFKRVVDSVVSFFLWACDVCQGKHPFLLPSIYLILNPWNHYRWLYPPWIR